MTRRNKMLFGLAIVVLVGCPRQEPTVLVAQANLPLNDQCLATPSASQYVYLPEGTLDLSANRDGYLAAVQLFNNMSFSNQVTGLGATNARLDTSMIRIVGAMVSYEVSGLDVSLPSEFFAPTTVTINPTQASIAAVRIIPSEVVQLLRTDKWFTGPKSSRDPMLNDCRRVVTGEDKDVSWSSAPIGGREARILVRMTFEGRIGDGTQVLSNELRYPIRICNGCLMPKSFGACELARQINLGKSVMCDKKICVAGQDTCVDQFSCFNDYYYVDAKDFQMLNDCAKDPVFLDAHKGEVMAGCDDLLYPFGGPGAATPGERLNHLLIRHALSQVQTYCGLAGDSPLYETSTNIPKP